MTVRSVATGLSCSVALFALVSWVLAQASSSSIEFWSWIGIFGIAFGIGAFSLFKRKGS